MIRTLRVFVALLSLAALVPSTASAFGGLRRSCGGCEVAACAPVAAPAPVEVKYEERTVTRYKPVTVEREVTCIVNRMVPRDVTYTAMVPVMHKEKRMVSVCVPVWREVEHRYTEMIPRIIKEQVKQTVYQRNVREVEDTVPVSRIVRTPCTDECGRCYDKCERVTEMVKVKRCVVDCVPVVRDVEVCRTVCDRVERVGVRKVCDMHREQREVEVCVVRCHPEERVRKVYDCVPERVTRKVQVCEMQPYQETVRVPVCATTESCDSGCGHRRVFGGLFNRRGGCCN